MNTIKLVDSLGTVQAAIAELEQRARAIKDKLIACGAGAYEGDLFRATVSTSERESLDMKAVRAKLSPQFIAAHTKITFIALIRKINGQFTVDIITLTKY